jgi:hypothetical protein
MKDCKLYHEILPDLVFDPQSVSDEAKTHVAACKECRANLESLRATLSLMDTWEAPAITPYFDVRMAARLREERAAAPASWFELLRARLQFLPTMQRRPLLAGALATLIMVGGGAFAGLTPPPVAPSAAVTDLRMMDRNAKVLDQMDQLLQSDNDSGATTDSTLNP